ncbi:hypothetical protein OZX62_08840 [Bifidobacterium sp. ESL0690]|uniref:hypothetical protein n=1 Tax=Bifidobacterium sp. ESL0690 TaxID=2983214 RepID=UPI0023F69BF4|nr:hypothetical protein [Bifidobacterium sp. ESL0690]WEV46525.1 hypothetical protein OZX62_08840 [Bifidobacterium sp. ESL0690]
MPYSDNLRADIARTDQRISDLSDQLNAAKQNLNRLRELLSYVSYKQNSFLNEQGRRQNSFNKIWQDCANCRSAVGYSNVMGDILFGNAPNNVAGAYSEGIQSVNQGIQRAEEEIGDLQRSIANAENYRADQVSHLQRVLAEEQWEAQQEAKKAAMRARGEW